MKNSPRRPATKPSPQAKPARPITKRQLSRHQRDQRLQRLAKIGFGGLVAILIFIVAFGYWREVVAPGGEAILRVRGTDITTQTYAKVLGYRQYQLDLQMANLQAFAQSSQGDDESAQFLQQYVQQQLQQMSQQRATLETIVLEELIDDQFVVQEAAKRGIDVTNSDIDAEIYKVYAPAPAQSNDEAPTATSEVTGTETSPAPTPQPTATPMTQEQALENTRQQINDSGFMTEAEYRDLIVKPQVLRGRLQEQLAEGVETTAEQVWARHILVDNEELAKEILAKAQSGTDFASLAKEFSSDSSNKETGGDLGWFGRGAMVPEFETAAFALGVGQTVTEPVQTSFGYHIIEALGHEQARPLSEDQLKQAKDGAVNNWLKTVRKDEAQAIEYGYSWERVKWARDWVESNSKYLKAEQAAARR